MQFIFRGEFSKGLDTQTVMGVTFRGREPSEVTDAPAISWLEGHPVYERVAEELAPERKVTRRIMATVPPPPKKAAKKPAAKKAAPKKKAAKK
jgi:hypothetical protein